MKKETAHHPKVKKLMRALAIGRPQALGHLQLLWWFTADMAPRGDVGKWDDESIADACDWDGDPAKFVEALVATRWLDRHEQAEIRLIVHNWMDHCEQSVLNKLKAARDKSGTGSDQGATGVPPGSDPSGTRVRPGSLTEPNRTKPNQTRTGPGSAGAFSKLTDRDIRDPDRLFNWCGQNKAVVGSTEMDLLNVFGAAERAIAVGKKPVALFIDIVQKREWSLISSEQSNAARLKIRDLQAKLRSQNASAAT